jgi:hypothetical protein
VPALVPAPPAISGDAPTTGVTGAMRWFHPGRRQGSGKSGARVPPAMADGGSGAEGRGGLGHSGEREMRWGGSPGSSGLSGGGGRGREALPQANLAEARRRPWWPVGAGGSSGGRRRG